jgi:vacuolar-type H+-ATPase subunit I/STV1
MGYSLFVTLCCCWIVGLFAVARAAECRSAIRVGNRPEAELRSKQARKYSNMALWLGIVSIIVTVIIFGLYYGLVITRRYY